MKSKLENIASNTGRFQDGNPSTGELGTVVTAKWLNDVQDFTQDIFEEANHILALAGFQLKQNKSNQLAEAIAAYVSKKCALKVSLTGNETIAGEKTFTSKLNAYSGIELGLNSLLSGRGYTATLLADSQAFAIDYGSQRLTLDKNGLLAVSGKRVFSENQKPRFNQDISEKPSTLAGYDIRDFVVKNLTTEDLDSIVTVGIYGQPQSAQAETHRHYPENKAGSLMVSLSSYEAMQTYTTYDNHNIYIRNKTGASTWSVWKRVNSEGLPIGAILSFPRAISHPQGFLQCNGSTFAQNTYPDLYRALGNSNRLPNLTRSDIGMTAYFAVDNIPEGWIAFDDIATQVTQQRYPELYRYLTTKYGAIANVPKIADRFIRNAGEGLRVGQIQNDQIGKHVHNIGLYNNDLTVDYHSNFFKSFTLDTSIRTVMSYDADTFNNGWATPKDTSPFATGGDENRPKALVLKFCIKAKDQFDDAVFWIKAFGEVENAGTLNAGRLAQDLQQQQHQLEQAQRDVASVQQAQTQTSTELTRLAQQQNIVKKSRKVWQGNITQNSTNIIQLSESILDKTLVFFMQISQAHTLQDNNDVYVASVYIDGALMECNGKKYARGAYRINDWNSLNIEIIDNNRIRIIDVGSLYVKQINAR